MLIWLRGRAAEGDQGPETRGPSARDLDGASGRRIIRMRPSAAVRNPRPRYAPQGDPQDANQASASGQAAAGAVRRRGSDQQPSTSEQRRAGSVGVAPSATPQAETRGLSASVLEHGSQSDASSRGLPVETPSGRIRQDTAMTSSDALSRQSRDSPSAETSSEAPQAGLEPLKKLRVRELRQLCVQHGLTQYGRKDELLERLAANVEEFKRPPDSVGSTPQA